MGSILGARGTSQAMLRGQCGKRLNMRVEEMVLLCGDCRLPELRDHTVEGLCLNPGTFSLVPHMGHLEGVLLS